MESANENTPSIEVNEPIVEKVDLTSKVECDEDEGAVEIYPQSEEAVEKVVEIVEDGPGEVLNNKTEEKGKKEDEETEDKTEKKEQPDEWTLIGSVCLTPCGHGVISQRTDDGTAIVLLVASYFLFLQFILQ